MANAILVQGGSVIDGTGAPPREQDVEIVDGKITRVQSNIKPGKHEVIDARGCIVTPGFVDVHTHYDGQVMWNTSLNPSSLNGVTTVVMGNCAVGFAPCRPERREMLIELMEAIEDIPGPVLKAGLPWNWRTFPEYLDALEARHYDIDVAAQLPHGPLRVDVMGDRAVRREAATAQDRAEMARLAGEAVRAGAVGFTTSRIAGHKTKSGDHTPDFMAAEIELQAIADALGKERRGVLQVVTDIAGQREAGLEEFQMLRRLVQKSGRPMSMTVNQRDVEPDGARRLLDMISQANRDGIPIKGQIIGRPIGLVLGLDVTLNPFVGRPSYAQIAELPLAERVRALADPQLRARILSEKDPDAARENRFALWEKLFPLDDDLNYEPLPQDSVAGRATAAGVAPEQWAYDYLLQDGGRRLLYRPLLNFYSGNLDGVYDMLTHPYTLPGIGDGGAHQGMTCDSSISTYDLAYWGRDRTRGPRLPIEHLVKAHTSLSADAVQFTDRGVLAPGKKGDVNVIDFAQLRTRPVEVLHDLPLGARRLVQKATGYVATLVSGVPIVRHDEPTGARPGRLVRSSRFA